MAEALAEGMTERRLQQPKLEIGRMISMVRLWSFGMRQALAREAQVEYESEQELALVPAQIAWKQYASMQRRVPVVVDVVI